MAESKEDMFEYIETTLKPMPKEECTKMYSDWSEEYEKDIARCKYTAYKGAADCFADLGLPKDAKILDCGAGTGLLGAELAKKGFVNLNALDGCEKMLEQAKKKNIYKDVVVSYVIPESPLAIEEGTYDALVMVGVYCPGHFPMKLGTFKQLLRVLKKGGVMTWGMASPGRYAERDETYANNAFHKIIQSLIDEGIAEMVPGHPKIYAEYFKGEEGLFYALKKL